MDVILKNTSSTSCRKTCAEINVRCGFSLLTSREGQNLLQIRIESLLLLWILNTLSSLSIGLICTNSISECEQFGADFFAADLLAEIHSISVQCAGPLKADTTRLIMLWFKAEDKRQCKFMLNAQVVKNY